LFVVLNLICELRNANTQRENTFTSFRAITKMDILYWWNLWQFKINPGLFTQVKFMYNCEPLFITVFFFIYRIPHACVIKFAVKSNIFVSTETKYVSQIHLDVSQIYCGSCHHQAFQAFAIPLLFNGKWPDCVCCLMLPGKIVTCQSSVEWNEFCHVPSSTECISLIFVYRVTFHFIQSPFLLVKIPQQLTLQSEFLMLRTFFFSLRMIICSSSWRIGHVNFSCRAGNLRWLKWSQLGGLNMTLVFFSGVQIFLKEMPINFHYT